MAQGLRRGWSDTVLRSRIAEVVGLDPRRAQALQKYRDGMAKEGVQPARAERQAKAYARRLLKQRMRVLGENEVRLHLMAASRLHWQEMQEAGDFSRYAVRVTRTHPDERRCKVCGSQNGLRRSLWADIYDGPPFHPLCRCDEVVVDRGDPAGDTGAMTVEKAITPGGRVGDDSPLSNKKDGPRRLANYVRMIAHALMRKGMEKGHAIAIARNTLARWARGGGDVSPKVRAAAAKALAEQKALDAGRHVAKADSAGYDFDTWGEMASAMWDDPIVKARARGAVDGDGDGFVYDGTPRKRPATPAERAAGAAQRAARGQGGAGAGKKAAAPRKAAAPKKAAAKNDYDKRVDKFERAIAQALRSSNKKAEVKRVHDLIGQDFVLKKPDRDDLQALLAARAGGRPDPAPRPGSNRHARGVRGAPDAPSAPKAQARPAKKAAAPAKRAAPAPAKQAPAKKVTERQGVPVGRKTADSLDRLDAADRARAAKKATPAPQRARNEQRGANGRPILPPKPSERLPSRRPSQSAASRIAQALREGLRPRTPKSATPHGPKTQAWQRLVQRDIANAKSDREFAALKTQVNNLRRDGRISSAEHRDLHMKIAERENALRKDRSNAESAAQRLHSKINAAANTQDLRDIQAHMKGAGRDDARAIKGHDDLLRQVNDKFKDRARRIVAEAEQARRPQPPAKKASTPKPQQPTINPPSQPGAAIARARARLPMDWKRRIEGVQGISDIENLMDALEGDQSVSDKQYNDIAAVLNDQMEEFEQSFALNDYFDGGGDPFAIPKEMSKAHMWEVLQANPRFNVQRFNENGNVSQSYRVTDTKTGKTFFVKDNGGGKDGAGKEAMAGAVGNVLGWMDHRAVLGQPGEPGDGGDHVVIESAFDPKRGRLHSLGNLKRRMQTAEVARLIAEGPDPDSLMRMMLFDYLVANDEDRHYMNMHVVEENGKMRAILLDHGRAFGGYRSDYRVAPAAANFSDWWPRYQQSSARGWDARGMMQEAYQGNDMARSFDSIVGKIKPNQIDRLVKQMTAQSGLTGANADEYATLVRNRLTHLTDPKNRDGIIRAFSR